MSPRQIVMVAVALTLAIGVVTGVGAASPAAHANADATDGYETNEPRDGGGVDGANADGTSGADRLGPASGLPEPVPDHVSAIHDAIASYLGGSIDSLGESLQGLLGSGQAAADRAGTVTHGAIAG